MTILSLSALAQEDKQVIIEKRIDEQNPPKKQGQEIVIRIKGYKVSINGKPLIEFKDDDITINKRNITIFDGKNKNKNEKNTFNSFHLLPFI